jgi:hypothetical protein
MRPKLILTAAGLAGLVLAAAFCLKQHIARLQRPAIPETAILPLPAAGDDLAEASPSTKHSKPSPVTRIATNSTQEQKLTCIKEEINRLRDLSTKDDPASLSAILRDLTNSEREIRLSAIEATKQLGNRDAIPTLRADVANTTDIGEQIALLEAADFLSLPTIADADVQQPKTPEQIQAAQQRRAQRAASRQASLPQNGQNQISQPSTDQNLPPDPNN